jgi:uncharacterized membrane protein
MKKIKIIIIILIILSFLLGIYISLFIFNYNEFLDVPLWFVIFIILSYVVTIIYGYIKCVSEGKKYKKLKKL